MSDDLELTEVMAEITRLLSKHADISSQIVLVSKTHAKSRVSLTPISSHPKINEDKAEFYNSLELDCEDEDYVRHVLVYLLVVNRDISQMVEAYLDQMGSEGKDPKIRPRIVRSKDYEQ